MREIEKCKRCDTDCSEKDNGRCPGCGGRVFYVQRVDDGGKVFEEVIGNNRGRDK